MKSSTFNSGGGKVGNSAYKSTYTSGEATIPSSGASSLFKLDSGFINTVYTPHYLVNQGSLVFNQSIQLDEDGEIQIILLGNEFVESYVINNLPKHGELLGEAPNLVYKPDNNYYGDDFFTFYGLVNGLKTNDGIISINVVNINDPPTLELVEGYVGNAEDQETTINYNEILKYIKIGDVENKVLTLLINKVISGTIYSDKPPPVDGKFVIKEGAPLQWRPEKDAYGSLKAFTLVVFDGQLYSDEHTFIISVDGVEDTPFIGKLIEDIEMDENSEDTVIDLSELFNDVDGDGISYFVKDWSNKLLLNPIIDGEILRIALNKNTNGKSIIEIGGESNGQFIYDEFEVKVWPKIDEDPFLVNEYWKGEYEGESFITIPTPVRIWSFSTKENIIKSKSGNWKYKNDQEDPVLSNDPLMLIRGNDWNRIYFQDGGSVRMQQQTAMELRIPVKQSGADWAKRNNKYSFVFDIKVQYGLYQPVLNTNNGNESNKSELWINPFGAVGGQGDYSALGALQSDKWYRLIYVVDGEDQTISYYIDEGLKKSRTILNMIDGRHSIGEVVKVGDDSQIANKNYELKRIIYYDYPLNHDQINFLGLMSFEEFAEENSRSQGEGNTFIYLYTGGHGEGENPSIFMTTNEEYANWNLQISNNLLNWTNYKVIETTKDENAEENLRFGHLYIDDDLNKDKQFYRVQAVE